MFLTALFNFYFCNVRVEFSVKGHSAANLSRSFENPACFMAAFISILSNNTSENLLYDWKLMENQRRNSINSHSL